MSNRTLAQDADGLPLSNTFADSDDATVANEEGASRIETAPEQDASPLTKPAERTFSSQYGPHSSSSSFLTSPPTSNNQDTVPNPEISSTSTRFANLAVHDEKRAGKYGAAAFGVQQASPVTSTFAHPCLIDQNNGTNQAAALQTNTQDPRRPVKFQKIVHNQLDTGVVTGPRGQHAIGGLPAEIPLQTSELSQSQMSALAHGVVARQCVRRPFISGPQHAHNERPSLARLQQLHTSSALHKAGTDIDRDETGSLYRTGRLPTTAGTAPQKVIKDNDHVVFGNQAHRLTTPVKHKRNYTRMANDILPPVAFIWQTPNNPSFTVFQGFLLYPELCFLLAAHLPLRDLIGLYAISRDFHTIIDSRFTTTCLTIAINKAPESAKIFHFRMYANLCRIDPANRIPHPDPIKAANRQPRKIPSFRWVAFVLFREKVVHELMAVFAEKGVPLPPKCQKALKKMWLLMDIPDNARRIGLIHNRNIMTNEDLYFMFCFFVKLDMVCNDPLATEKNDGIRKLLLSQQDGLLPVLLVLKRIMWKRQADLLIAWVRNSCEITGALDDENFDQVAFGAESIFGVPIKEAGLGKFEYWGTRGALRYQGLGGSTISPTHQSTAPAGTSQVSTAPAASQTQNKTVRYQVLMRPDQLVMREATRRGLRMSEVALQAVLSGYIDETTMSSFAPRAYPRRIPEWNNEEYEVDDLVGGVCAFGEENDIMLGHGRNNIDAFLDLGDSHHGTPLIVHNGENPMQVLARTLREQEEKFWQSCDEEIACVGIVGMNEDGVVE